MKRKETGADLTEEELTRMAATPDVVVLYDPGSPERRLYNKFVREFLGSDKIRRTQATGAEWHADKKLKHVWRRYCDDDAYAHMTMKKKREIMVNALTNAVDMSYTAEDIAEATMEDYAAREGAALRKQIVPGMPEKIATALAEAAANKLSGGVYGLVRISSNLADGQHRLEVAQRYAAQYATMSGSDDLTLDEIRSLDEEGLLGVSASFLAMKLERFERRQLTVLAAQTLSVAGAAFGLIPVVGQGLDAAFSAASTVVGATVKIEQAFNNLKKRIDGNLGFARETIAVSLWGQGRRAFEPTLQFLTDLGLIDGPTGVLASNGFFDRCNMRLATNFIAEQLKSTARTGKC